MIRSSAKNHVYVNVVVDVADYAKILDALKANNGATPLGLRRELAAKAYAHTGAYDAMIATWFARQNGESFLVARIAKISPPSGLRIHVDRSEEHTSELQSLMRISYAVFCLKKTKKTHDDTQIHNNHTSH